MILASDLAPEHRIATSHAPAGAQDKFAALFALDRQLGLAVARGHEPIAIQLRLAWWREAFGNGRIPRGDERMTAICKAWHGQLAELVPMVDGWEELVAETPDLAAVAAGRAAPFLTLARDLGCNPCQLDATRAAVERWLLVDLAEHHGDPQVRSAARARAHSLARPATSLPRAMRPIALLDGLARRALRRGGAMFGDRLSPLAAMRLGIFGR